MDLFHRGRIEEHLKRHSTGTFDIWLRQVPPEDTYDTRTRVIKSFSRGILRADTYAANHCALLHVSLIGRHCLHVYDRCAREDNGFRYLTHGYGSGRINTKVSTR